MTDLPRLDTPELPAGAGARKLLIVGVDGLRWDRIAVSPAPVLQELIATGQYGVGAHPFGSPAKTMSGPGWSTMLTGVSPARHGVRDNNFKGRRYDRYPDLLTLAKRSRPELSTYAAVDWPPLVGKGLFGPAIDVRIRLDGERNGYHPEDVRLADVSTRVLAERDPDLAFVYLGCVDEAGHREGPLSDLYRERLAAVDAMIGVMLAAVRARPRYADEHWLVLVSTDHGHVDAGGHGGSSEAERAIFAIAHGYGVRPGTRRDGVRTVDIAPTALTHLGVPIDPAWELEGRSLLDPAAG